MAVTTLVASWLLPTLNAFALILLAAAILAPKADRWVGRGLGILALTSAFVGIFAAYTYQTCVAQVILDAHSTTLLSMSPISLLGQARCSGQSMTFLPGLLLPVVISAALFLRPRENNSPDIPHQKRPLVLYSGAGILALILSTIALWTWLIYILILMPLLDNRW